MRQPKPPSADRPSKVQRYRHSRSRRGMKQLRIWVPGPKQPDFSQEVQRQADLLRGSSEEHETLAFIEGAFEWPEP